DLSPVNLNLAPAAAPINCFDPERILDGSSASSANGLEYVWTYEGPVDTVSRAAAFTADRVGTYTLTAIDVRSRCLAVDEVELPGDTVRPVAFTGPPQIELNCYRSDTLLGGGATSVGSRYRYAWVELNQADVILSQNRTLPVATGGVYRLTVFDDVNGCTAADSTLVRAALDTPFLRLELPLDFDCFIDSVSLDARATNLAFPNVQNWSGPCVPAVTDTSQVWVECPGTYVYEVLNLTSGCSARDSVTVGLAATGVVALLPDTAFLDCDTGETRLDRRAGTDAPVVRWFRDGTPVNLVGQQPTVTVPGTYTLVLGNFNESCLDTARTVVTADCAALAVIIPPDSLTCNTALVQLDARPSVPEVGPNVMGEWIIPMGAVVQPGASERELTVFSAGRYGYALHNLISRDRDTAYVEVVRNVVQPVAEAGPRDTLNCYDEMVTLDAGASSQGPQFEYLWTTTNDDTLAFTQQVTVEEAGTYLLRVTQRMTGCSRVDNVIVRRDVLVPDLDFTDTEMPCEEESFALAVLPDEEGDYAYAWTGPDVVTDADRDTVQIGDVGTYSVTVTNLDNGCPAIAEVDVSRLPCPPFPVLLDTSLTCFTDTIRLATTFREPCFQCIFRWTRNGVPLLGQTDSVLAVTETGTYEVIVFNGFGLRGRATSTVTDARVLPEGNAGPDRLLTCAVTEIWLGNPAPEPSFPFAYQWLDADGVTLPGATDDSLRVTGGDFYQLRSTNLFSGCSVLDTARIDYDTLRPVANAGTSRLLDCNNKRRTLDGIQSSLGDRYVYVWAGGPSPLCLEGETTLNPIVRCGGTYQLTVRDTVNGCTAAASVVVENDDELPAVIPLRDTMIDCTADTVRLIGRPVDEPNRVFRWEQLTSGGSTAVPEESPGVIAVTEGGDFRFTVENALTGCQNDFVVAVAADLRRPVAEAGPVDTFYCELDSLQVSGMGATTSGRTAIFNWISATGFFVNNATQAAAMIFQPDVYYFRVTDPGNGCVTTDSVLIARDIEAPLALAGNDTSLTCTLRELELNGGWRSLSGQATFNWTTRDGRILSGRQTLNPLIDTVGRYQLNVTDPVNDCSAADIVRVREDTIAPQAMVSLPQGREVNCDRPRLLLRGEGNRAGLLYRWSGPTGALGRLPDQLVSAAGMYQLVVENGRNGCQDTVTAAVEEDFLIPTTPIQPAAPLTCLRSQVRLLPELGPSSPFYQYTWLNEAGTDLGDNDTLVVTATGSYRLVTRDIRNGCRDTARLFVDANLTPPEVQLAEPLVLNCNRSFTTIDGMGSSRGGNFVVDWDSPGNSAVPSGDPYQVRGSIPGFYYLTVVNRDNGCSATDSVELLRSALAVDDLALEVDQPACVEDPTGSVMVLGVDGGQGPFRYRLDGGLLTDRLVYEGLPPGRYSLEAVGADGCSTERDFVINPGQPIFVDLLADTLIRLGDSIALNFATNLPRWDSLVWSSSGFLPALTSDGPITVRPLSSQGYRLLIVGPDGCTATDETVIEVNGEVRTYVPTAFSPNGDQTNDKFRPFYASEVERILNFRVYDRWGEMLYNYLDDPFREGEDFGWDGNHEGHPLNPQVLGWTLEVLLVDGEVIRLAGEAVLVR
ncbi:MAG: hypothetical protein AAFZ52_00315, partial [Bacteroidota bacterium]